ncbi:MAG: hypothetical protein WA668_12040 [Candidatus Cybelea sp.]
MPTLTRSRALERSWHVARTARFDEGEGIFSPLLAVEIGCQKPARVVLQ